MNVKGSIVKWWGKVVGTDLNVVTIDETYAIQIS